MGCPRPTEVDQKIVNLAVSELQGGDDGKCRRNVIKVENFKQQVCFDKYEDHYDDPVQVVAGMMYHFDLVMKHDNQEADGCSRAGGEEERCHVKVLDRPWEKIRKIHSTTCDRDPLIHRKIPKIVNDDYSFPTHGASAFLTIKSAPTCRARGCLPAWSVSARVCNRMWGRVTLQKTEGGYTMTTGPVM